MTELCIPDTATQELFSSITAIDQPHTFIAKSSRQSQFAAGTSRHCCREVLSQTLRRLDRARTTYTVSSISDLIDEYKLEEKSKRISPGSVVLRDGTHRVRLNGLPKSGSAMNTSQVVCYHFRDCKAALAKWPQLRSILC